MKLTLYRIVNKLAGPIRPTGETNADRDRKVNLAETIELVEELLEDIRAAAESADRPEASMAAIGKMAADFLDSLKEVTP